MLRTLCFLSFVALGLFVPNLSASAQTVARGVVSADASPTVSRPADEFAGRYTDGEDYVVYFVRSRYGLTVRPALWTATQLLSRSGADRFVVSDRPARTVVFRRGGGRRVTGVVIRGFDGEERTLFRAGPRPLPVEILLAGRGQEAARAYLANGVTDAGRVARLAERVLKGFPSRSKSVVGFLSVMAPRFRESAALHTLLGYAQVAAGDRRSARRSFLRAHQLSPTDKDAISGLARLGALPPSAVRAADGWTLPFALDAVFEKPTAAEVRAVEADWRARDLTPRGVREVARGEIDFGQSRAVVRVVSHTVHGQRHYGAIIIPAGATRGCCPVVVEAKGVSPTYFPLELEKVRAPRLLENPGRRFIYVVPSFRGEVLHFGGVAYQSEGDRTDALDGATDDALALLNVALQTTPEADAGRVCAFGHSRGGTVALLMGVRDRRITCVVDWAGPTDWFELMGTGGWTEQELFAEGLRTRASPTETGGQNVERFLLKAIRGEEDLRAVRRRMLASSPLYFARRLPRLQLHYGAEDSSVPIRNGLRLVAELKRHRVPTARRQAFFYPGEGHDTDRIAAPVLTRQFITKALLGRAPKN